MILASAYSKLGVHEQPVAWLIFTMIVVKVMLLMLNFGLLSFGGLALLLVSQLGGWYL